MARICHLHDDLLHQDNPRIFGRKSIIAPCLSLSMMEKKSPSHGCQVHELLIDLSRDSSVLYFTFIVVLSFTTSVTLYFAGNPRFLSTLRSCSHHKLHIRLCLHYFYCLPMSHGSVTQFPRETKELNKRTKSTRRE